MKKLLIYGLVAVVVMVVLVTVGGSCYMLDFALMPMANMLCQWRYGWNFRQASALDQVRHCRQPMLFIHGGSDAFVPTEMVYRLYDAKPSKKELWVTEGTVHAESYKNYKEEYIRRIRKAVRIDQRSQ